LSSLSSKHQNIKTSKHQNIKTYPSTKQTKKTINFLQQNQQNQQNQQHTEKMGDRDKSPFFLFKIKTFFL